MRLAFTVHKFPPESLGGTEIYTWSLARTLAAAGHEVHVFYPATTLPPGMETDEATGIRLWRAAPAASQTPEDPVRQYWHTFRNRAFEGGFARFLEQVRPEVVHFQHVQGVSARLIELAAAYPRLVTLHDYWYFCANSQLVRPERRLCGGPSFGCWNCVDCATERADLNWLRALRPLVALPFAYRNRYLRALAGQVDLFIAPSRFLRQQYVLQGFPAERIRVIENGVDLGKLQERSGLALPTPPAHPAFGFVGTLAWQKGVHVLVEAFNRLPEQASLTLYGSEEAFPDYAAQVRAAARHAHIRFGGRLDPQSVGSALRRLDCLVVPSLWYENSPLVIQEAYAVGLPVVASRLGALAEKVEDGRTGRLFNVGDGDDLARVLQDLVAHPGKLVAMREAITPAPDMEAHAGQLLSIYRELAHR